MKLAEYLQGNLQLRHLFENLSACLKTNYQNVEPSCVLRSNFEGESNATPSMIGLVMTIRTSLSLNIN